MTLRAREVAVIQLPDTLDLKRRKILYRELESCMNSERPSVVLDCSMVRQMEVSAIHVLLFCLEEAMKRNGDIRLAALTPDAMKRLEAAGVDRLFQTFNT